MVLCVVFGCSKRSGRDKDVHFYRIPKVVKNRGESTEKLSEKRRAGFLSAIKRVDITDKILVNDRICSRHFISGQPASLLDQIGFLLPTLNLGHSKEASESRVKAAEMRWKRAKVKESLKVTETQTELTSIGIEDIKDYAQYYRAKCATLNKRQLYGEVMFRNDVNCIQACPTSLFLKLFFTLLPLL